MSDKSGFTGFASLGAAAAVALPATGAMAQDAASTFEGYTLTVDGGIGRGSMMVNAFEDKGGSDEIPHEKGFYGSVSLSRAISEDWDWRVSASILANGDSQFGQEDFIEVTMGFDGLNAIADFGKHLTYGKTKVRLGVGVIGTHYAGRSYLLVDVDGPGGNVPIVDVTLDETYRGIGPAISAEVEHPVSSNGRTKLIGGLSIGKTFGSTDSQQLGNANGNPVDKLGSTDASAVMKSAYLGLSFQTNERQEWRFGVRTDRLSVSYDEFGGILADNAEENSIFVGMKMQF